jgi:two-component system, OmpR family, phosphate regulon sensor histidine kinase PhoR
MMRISTSRYLPVLLMVTILVIFGFQLYWIRQIYGREKKALETKTAVHFREVIFALQAKQLDGKFEGKLRRDSTFNVVIRNDNEDEDNVNARRAEEVIGMSEVLRRKGGVVIDQRTSSDGRTIKTIDVRGVRDSQNVRTLGISLTRDPRMLITDTDKHYYVSREANWEQPGNHIITFFNNLDSLTDSLKINDIFKETTKSFQNENVNVPFHIVKKGFIRTEREPPLNECTVGFSNPVTYRLELGNSFPYLFQKMLSPLLFSIFLMGVTLASIVVLYRSLRQQQRLAALKDDFISNVTHELKTPIATVNVALEALKNFNAMNNPQRTSEYLDISQQELQRLSLLVDKVLRISMFENSKVELTSESFNLVSLINDVKSSMRLQFEKQRAVVQVRTEGDDFTVSADKLHIMSVIYNMFDNALKYSKGDPIIEVLVKESGSDLEIRFADNGIGIPEAYKHRVFEKFFRVPKGDVHDVKGYGLGLSYVSHIINGHKGSIRVESVEGQGSEFIIQIPRKYA